MWHRVPVGWRCLLFNINPQTQTMRFDLTKAGFEEGPNADKEVVPSEIASIGQAGCASRTAALWLASGHLPLTAVSRAC